MCPYMIEKRYSIDWFLFCEKNSGDSSFSNLAKTKANKKITKNFNFVKINNILNIKTGWNGHCVYYCTILSSMEHWKLVCRSFLFFQKNIPNEKKPKDLMYIICKLCGKIGFFREKKTWPFLGLYLEWTHLDW